MPSDSPHPVTLWMTPVQEPMLRSVCERANLRVVAVGSSEAGQSRALADRFGVKALDDVRSAIARAEAPGLILLAAPGSFGAVADSTVIDAEAVRAARGRGVRLASLEPMPAALVQLISAGLELPAPVARPSDAPAKADELRTGLVEWATIVPLSRHVRSVREVIEASGTFAPARSASIVCMGSTSDGSLGARLFDAMDLALTLLGEPESIDASFTCSDPARSLHPLPGESLRELSGDLSANLRYATGKAASVYCSNCAGRYELRVSVVSPAGRVSADLVSSEMIGAGGARLDPPKAISRSEGPSMAQVMADQLDTIVRGSATGGVDFVRVMAMAQAALLSTRTGEPESPATMLKMSGV